METNIDDVVRKNLLRIMKAKGLNQNTLASIIETTPQYMSDILRGERGMGPDIMARLCRKLKVELWQFYVTEKSPIILDEEEQRDLVRRREARAAGVAEETARYEIFRISEARKLPVTDELARIEAQVKGKVRRVLRDSTEGGRSKKKQA